VEGYVAVDPVGQPLPAEGGGCLRHAGLFPGRERGEEGFGRRVQLDPAFGFGGGLVLGEGLRRGHDHHVLRQE
jgi:hypothetical protein